MSGFRRFKLQAVRLAGATGELEETDHIVWSHNEGTSYTPSALVYGDNIYFLRHNSGVLSCLDARTGEVCYDGQRLGIRTVYSSPVGAADRIYVTDREGKTKVVQVGPDYVDLATNQLDDGFDATAAIAGDELYLRGKVNLYCIAAK